MQTTQHRSQNVHTAGFMAWLYKAQTQGAALAVLMIGVFHPGEEVRHLVARLVSGFLVPFLAYSFVGALIKEVRGESAE